MVTSNKHLDLKARIVVAPSKIGFLMKNILKTLIILGDSIFVVPKDYQYFLLFGLRLARVPNGLVEKVTNISFFSDFDWHACQSVWFKKLRRKFGKLTSIGN